MKIVFKLGLLLLLVVSSNGCASSRPADQKMNDSRIESPGGPGVEIHGYMSTTISTEIK